MPVRLNEKYLESANDPELLSLREDIALLDARLLDVLSRVDTGESGQLWRSLHEAACAYKQASGRDAAEKRQEALDTICQLIDTGDNDRAAWAEVTQLLMARRKLVEGERKRLVDMGQMMSTQQANVMLGAVAHIIKSHINDRDALQAISVELAALVSRSGS